MWFLYSLLSANVLELVSGFLFSPLQPAYFIKNSSLRVYASNDDYNFLSLISGSLLYYMDQKNYLDLHANVVYFKPNGTSLSNLIVKN